MSNTMNSSSPRTLDVQSYVYNNVVDCLPEYCKLMMLRGNNKVGIDCGFVLHNKHGTEIAVYLEITPEASVTIVTRGGNLGNHTVDDLDVKDVMPYLFSIYSCK